jgi:cytochrome c553
MIKKLLSISISLALFTTTIIVHAKSEVNTGKQQAVACAGCHGAEGNSVVATFPKLAGQHATYLIKELKALKSGSRNAPMMAPMAMGLTDNAITELATFYASQTVSSNPTPSLPLTEEEEDEDDETALAAIKKAQKQKLNKLLTEGRNLYRNGHLETKVSACIACHGVYGDGNQPAGFPVLKGQHADYLIKTLTDYQQGNRSNDAENIMNMIAQKMTTAEIRAVSYYISVMKHEQTTAK